MRESVKLNLAKWALLVGLARPPCSRPAIAPRLDADQLHVVCDFAKNQEGRSITFRAIDSFRRFKHCKLYSVRQEVHWVKRVDDREEVVSEFSLVLVSCLLN